WNRLNYESSQQICQQLGMSLATATEFKALRDSGVMEKNKWPLQLPYWGKDKKGLFADREPNQLTGTSLLNVMCVK
ncbi:SPOR domain-containing protein, partial [Vibrio parahaemolyticus]